MSEHNETVEITDEAIEEFIDHGTETLGGAEAPSYHPILRVWREVLAPAAEVRLEKVTPQWANRMVQTYPHLTYADCADLHDRYYDKLAELAAILDVEIDTDDDCLSYTTPEEDLEHNAHHYKNLLLNWQMQVLQWELDWDCTAPDAAVEIGAISETHKFFFSQTGLTAFLDNIRFHEVYTEADQEALAEALQELKEGAGE